MPVVASWKIDTKPTFYFAMLMLLQVGMNGVFLALDFVLFYVFWELVLVPMYFLIAQWGGPRREYAAIKFFLYTLLGSVFMLVGIVALYLNDRHVRHGRARGASGTLLPAGLQWWLFLLFFLGFAVKVPIWPLHTWLPDAHVEAPTAASALLAGVLLKMGTYGFMRVSLPMLPAGFHAWQWFLAVLAIISIVYGAAVAFAQTDIKKLVAYSSVSHMGFAMLGIASGTAIGIDGAVAVSFSHGLIAGMLFLMVGMVYDRTHTREISELSGPRRRRCRSSPGCSRSRRSPRWACRACPASSASSCRCSARGSPTCRTGSCSSSALGVLLGAAYMLWMIQRVVLGQPSYVIADCPRRDRCARSSSWPRSSS